jgi:hypothetical protein
MDFKLEISRDSVTYYKADLFPNQQLEYDVDFYDRIEIDKVRLPFSTDLRIPLTTLNKSTNLFNFEPVSDQGIDFPKDDFYFRLTIYGTSQVSIEGILNLASVEYNSSEPYAQVILKDYISRYLAQMKTKNLSVIYSDSYYTTEQLFSRFLRPWNALTNAGEAGVVNTNPDYTRAINFPYVDFVNDVDGKYGYAARQFIEYGTGIGRTGIMPVFSVTGFLTLLGSYLNGLDANFDVRIDSKLFGVGTPYAGNPLIPNMQPEKLQMVIPSQLLAKSATNPRTFDVRQSPAWAVPNASLSSTVDINQDIKEFYTQYFSGTVTSGNYGTDGEGNPIYPSTQEWGVEKRMGFYPCDPTAVQSEYDCNHIRGFFAPKVSFNSGISFTTGGTAAVIEQARYEIPVIQEDQMVGNIDIAASDMEFNVCIAVWVDGLQQKEITLLASAGGSPLVLTLNGATAVAGYSNKTDHSGTVNYDYFRPDDDLPVLWRNGDPAITDTILFEQFTAHLPSGEETFIDGGSTYSINYFLKPISGELSILRATSFDKQGNHWVKLASSTNLFGVTDIRKAISRFGLPNGSGSYGQMNLTFTANEDHLLYKNNDTFIIQESIEKTCPFNLSDVLLNIAKRFDCGLFYDYDSTAQKHILRIDPVFAVRSGTQNINQYVDDIKSYKITDGGDKVKTLNLKNKDYNLFFDDINNDGVTIGSTTQEINAEGIVELEIDLKSSIYYKSVCGEEDSFSSSNTNLQDSVISAEELGITPNIFTPNKDIGFRFAYLDKPLYKTNMLVPYMYQKGTKTDLLTEVQRYYSNANWGSSGLNIGGQHVFNGRLFNYNTAGWNLMFETESGVVTDTYSQIFAVSEKIIQSEYPSIEFDMVVPTDQLSNLSFFLKEFTASRMTGGTIYVKSAKGDVYEDFAYLTIEALLK